MYFPGDPLFRPGPDLQLGAGAGPRAPASPCSTSTPRCRTGRWPTGSTSCCGGRGRHPDRRPAMTGAPGVSTPSQTVGPFFAVGAALGGRRRTWCPPARPARSGCAAGCSTAPGTPVPDALVETWQADPDGAFDHPRRPARRRSHGPGRASAASVAAPPTRPAARRSGPVKPGPVPGPGGARQAPHVDVSVFARGLLDRVVTRLYFPDEEAANARRPGARHGGPAERRATLVAAATRRRVPRSTSASRATHETVFFAV